MGQSEAAMNLHEFNVHELSIRMNLHAFNVHELSIFIKCVDKARHSLDLDGKFATTVRALTQDQFEELIDLIHKELNLRCAEVDGNLDTEPDAYMDEMGNPWDQSITRAVYAFATIDYYAKWKSCQ